MNGDGNVLLDMYVAYTRFQTSYKPNKLGLKLMAFFVLVAQLGLRLGLVS